MVDIWSCGDVQTKCGLWRVLVKCRCGSSGFKLAWTKVQIFNRQTFGLGTTEYHAPTRRLGGTKFHRSQEFSVKLNYANTKVYACEIERRSSVFTLQDRRTLIHRMKTRSQKDTSWQTLYCVSKDSFLVPKRENITKKTIKGTDYHICHRGITWGYWNVCTTTSGVASRTLGASYVAH